MRIARRPVIASSLVLAAVGLLFACTVEEENPGSPSKSSGGDSGLESSTQADGSVTPVGDGKVCTAHGGYEKVRQVARAIIDGATADCRVGPMFNQLLEDKSAAEHTKGCFEQYFGASLGCSGVTFKLGESKAADAPCQSPLPNLDFSAKDWEAFGDFNASPQAVAVWILSGNAFTPDELRIVAPIFEGMKTNLIDNERDPLKFTQCTEVCTSGGDACIQPVILDGGNDAAKEAGPDASDAGDGG